MTGSGEQRKHPTEEMLTLFSSGDLGWRTRWSLRRHISHCAACLSEVERFRSASQQLCREARSETLTGFEAIADWNRLEREMVGNIAVGVDAARCIDNVGRHRFRSWRGAFVGAGLTAIFLAGWSMNIPKEQSQHLSNAVRRFMGFQVSQAAGTTVQTTPEGIAVHAQGATLTMMHSGSAVVTVAGSSSVGARYVDEDSGEVTITNVYGQ